MDDSVIRSIARWPNVPAVYGWMSLNRRGQWLLRNDPLNHERAIAFINRNYAGDAAGQWYFQNGPQRVYVALEYAPLIARFDHGGLLLHTGQPLTQMSKVLIDEQGNVVLDTLLGAVLLDDRELLAFSEQLLDADGHPADDGTIEALLEDTEASFDLWFSWQAQAIPIERAAYEKLPQLLGFVREPAAPADGA